MIIVADTSAISNLMTVGQEKVLELLFTEVTVPPCGRTGIAELAFRAPGFPLCCQAQGYRGG